jgi:hypothetical protein
MEASKAGKQEQRDKREGSTEGEQGENMGRRKEREDGRGR